MSYEELKALTAKHMRRDETLLWQGTSNSSFKKKLMRNLAIMVPISILVIGLFAVFGLSKALKSEQEMSKIIFVSVITAVTIFVTTIAASGNKVLYTITDKRILIASGKVVNTLQFKDISEAYIEFSDDSELYNIVIKFKSKFSETLRIEKVENAQEVCGILQNAIN